MKYYDLFIPIGAFCATSYHLRRCNLQTEALPFDWLTISNITASVTLIKNKFDGFFQKENLVFLNVNGTHNAYIDKKNNIGFFHCIDKDLPFDEGYAKARAMFDRRINRVFDKIDKAKSILFVYANNEPVSPQEALEAYEILKAIYPSKRIDLLVLDLKKDYKGIEAKEISKNVLFIKMEFVLEHDLYSGRKEAFAEIFQNYQIASWKKRLKNIFDKFIFNMKRISVSLVCMFIPSKQIRKKLRKKLKTNRCVFDR